MDSDLEWLLEGGEKLLLDVGAKAEKCFLLKYKINTFIYLYKEIEILLSLIYNKLKNKHLRHPIWTTGIERRGLRLRNFQNLSVHLT